MGPLTPNLGEMTMERFSLEGQAHDCGGTLHLLQEPGTFRIHGVDVPVTHRFYRCDGCAEEHVTEDLANVVQKEAAAVFRRQERFLSGRQIRALREWLGLTQEQLEAALGLGSKSLARWENDRILQNRSMDNLFRLIERDPSCVRHLAELHGADLPETTVLARTELIDSARWPRQLVARLSSAAAAEGTDLHTYLIWLLTEFTSVGSFSAHASREISETARRFRQVTEQERGGMPLYDEPAWKREHDDVMRDAALRATHGS